MIRLIFTFSLILIFSGLQSQTIAVKSFRKLETDQEARIVSPKTDQNGKKCAIIKAVTSQTGFIFDFGMIGNAIATEQKTAEIWVWVPAGARKVTIKHQQLGVLRDYPFNIDIEEATVYEMVLVSGTVTTTINEVITSQWLVIKSEPAKAMIYLDEQFVKTGEYQAKLKPGNYTYRVEAPLYHTEAGKVEITNIKKEIQVNLKPAFGFVNVTTSPESSATVIVDGKELSQLTPCKSEALASGEHTIQVVKEMFQPSTQKVTVSDDQTTPVNFTLKPNFAEVKLTSSADAILYINNEQKGTGIWEGRLNAGVYSLEARKEKHRTAKQDIELVAGDQRTVDLQPTPIYGSLDILSSPSGATIIIEGKDYGTTPNTINKLLIGEYTVKLSKTGYALVNKTVSITEGKNSEVNETLTEAKSSINLVNQPISGGETVTDIDGNIYHTLTIGTQVWMVENLTTTRFNNGKAIPNITDYTAWNNLKTPGYCWYSNSATITKNTYGALYNWHAVNTGKLAPKGWHVPTDEEWTILTTYLGGENIAGGKLKETGTAHWKSSNIVATNTSGFTALPAGYRGSAGTFDSVSYYGGWWSSTERNSTSAWYRGIYYSYSNVIRGLNYKEDGFSVRCLKDY